MRGYIVRKTTVKAAEEELGFGTNSIPSNDFKRQIERDIDNRLPHLTSRKNSDQIKTSLEETWVHDSFIYSQCHGGEVLNEAYHHEKSKRIAESRGVDVSDLQDSRNYFGRFSFINDRRELCTFSFSLDIENPKEWAFYITTNLTAPSLEERKAKIVYGKNSEIAKEVFTKITAGEQEGVSLSEVLECEELNEIVKHFVKDDGLLNTTAMINLQWLIETRFDKADKSTLEHFGQKTKEVLNSELLKNIMLAKKCDRSFIAKYSENQSQLIEHLLQLDQDKKSIIEYFKYDQEIVNEVLKPNSYLREKEFFKDIKENKLNAFHTKIVILLQNLQPNSNSLTQDQMKELKSVIKKYELNPGMADSLQFVLLILGKDYCIEWLPQILSSKRIREISLKEPLLPTKTESKKEYFNQILLIEAKIKEFKNNNKLNQEQISSLDSYEKNLCNEILKKYSTENQENSKDFVENIKVQTKALSKSFKKSYEIKSLKSLLRYLLSLIFKNEDNNQDYKALSEGILRSLSPVPSVFAQGKATSTITAYSDKVTTLHR